ncbi:helix-turn-helix domain-containing protein [Enterococcus mediterraneensis]|uniref:helix-turn-helix domain-containing protein n=1 Tax=Enterococcus mediterraneensis TaxID=2364791 RepID=UPI000F060742|nr:helix-turn-helix transcriptional regulator [Enterococcus mediterraneensis]
MNENITRREFYVALRKRKNIKQQELAQALHVARTVISRFENGKYLFDNERVKAYENYIDNKK